MNRRDFLPDLINVVGALHAPEPPPRDTPQELALLRYSREAMATRFEVVLPFGTPDATSIAESALDQIDRLEDQLTVYRDSSEVSRLNRGAAEGWVSLEENLFFLLRRSARLCEETGGAFDVTMGALIKAWGFYRRAGRVPAPEERAEVLKRVGSAQLEFDDQRRAVRFGRRGLEVNLGSIGKGYALDRVADSLRRNHSASPGLLHGGHSSVYAIGTDPTDDRGWLVGVAHPWEPRRLAVVRLRNRALGTSAATFQHLEYNGRKLGHILDPRIGWPAEGMASATVIAPNAAEADALATAFFVLGVDKARAYCDSHPQIGALLLPAGGAARPVLLGLALDVVNLSPPNL
ncbi:MAG: FAD:protein FMN transferase [Gemmataceae bacterium]|nr:FAD:protein FMN transferase [Gemmataceae bacterium]